MATYLSCLRLLKAAEVTVFFRVSMDYGFAENLKIKIKNYHDVYSDLLSGYFIDQPPASLDDKKVLEVIQTIKTLKKKSTDHI